MSMPMGVYTHVMMSMVRREMSCSWGGSSSGGCVWAGAGTPIRPWRPCHSSHPESQTGCSSDQSNNWVVRWRMLLLLLP